MLQFHQDQCLIADNDEIRWIRDPGAVLHQLAVHKCPALERGTTGERVCVFGDLHVIRVDLLRPSSDGNDIEVLGVTFLNRFTATLVVTVLFTGQVALHFAVIHRLHFVCSFVLAPIWPPQANVRCIFFFVKFNLIVNPVLEAHPTDLYFFLVNRSKRRSANNN